MSERSNGVSLSPATLGVLIAACLSVGSGGAFYMSRAEGSSVTATVPAVVTEHQAQHRQEDVQVNAVQQRVAVLEALVQESKERLQRIEEKLDRVLAR